MSASENPPAFPRTDSSWNMEGNRKVHTGADGMTLRDWFAGQALAGYLAGRSGERIVDASFADAAKGMYRFADAMLAERVKQVQL